MHIVNQVDPIQGGDIMHIVNQVDPSQGGDIIT